MSARIKPRTRLGKQTRWALLKADLEQQYLDRLEARWNKLGWSSLNLREKIIQEVKRMPRYENLTRG